MREIRAQKTGSDYSRLPKEVFYMYNRYLITGSTGFLGRAIIEKLVRRNVRVDALVLRNDPYAALRSFLQGVSLAANFSLRRIKNSTAETFNLPKQKILL